MAVTNKPKQKPQEITVEVNASAFVGSQFAQLANVSVNDNDVTFEFVYLHAEIKKGQVVSRVTMPHEQAELFCSLVSETIEKHNAKKQDD